MKTIYKYELEIDGGTIQFIDMPVGAEFLHACMQFGRPVLWALVESEGEREKVALSVVGTGQIVPFEGDHISTFLAAEYVWHVFLVRTVPPFRAKAIR